MAFDLPFRTPALVAAVTACLGIVLAVRGWKRLGSWTAASIAAALVLMALAAGGLRVAVPGNHRVQVIVDDSASTRGASYHDPAALQQRIRDLLGGLPYAVSRFRERDGVTRLPAMGPGPVLLFSDGQFGRSELAGPVYPVIDPKLESPDDARVVDIHPERGEAIAVLENQGGSRQAALDGKAMDLPPGRWRVALGPATQAHAVAIAGGDRWPENDRVSFAGEGPDQLELWNVGLPTTPGFRTAGPDALPAGAEGYLGCAALALDAGAAGNLSPAQQAAIARYVRDLGGSLVLVGRDPGWTQLRGTTLAQLSPLSVDPPLPQTQWLLLLDASGSMAQNEGNISKWQEALKAAEAMLRGVPVQDRVQVGSFAQEVHWWGNGPAGTMQVSPPAGLAPHGPTNLLPALTAALESGTNTRRELLLLTDAEVEIPDPAGLAQRMKGVNLRVSCLVLADGRGRSPLQALCDGTGGRLLVEANPQRWSAASRQLVDEVAPGRWRTQPIPVQMHRPCPEGAVHATGWNEAWAKEGATPVAAHGQQVLGAWWRVGVGQVTATAWWPGEAALTEIARNTQTKVTGDAYQIEGPTDEPVIVKVHAKEQPTLRFAPLEAEASEIPMRRTAPGEYEAAIPFGWRGGYATVLVGGEVIARRVLASTYEPEFAHIGTNRANLEELARQTGGRLIEPDERGPLPIRLPQQWKDLSVYCGLAAVILAGAAALQLRRKV